MTATAHPAGQALSAVLTYPVNGATNADMSQPLQWTSVANVQAYYLYVGTTVGAKNLIDTGEIQQTSYLALNLPGGQTVYARLWTKVENVWRYTDSTFSAGSLAATMTYPANGAANADISQPLQWTSVANVQAYYLYLGTTAGAKNLVDTGEILQTSYVAPALPGGQTIYARLWTKVGNVWRYTDSTFTALSLAAVMTYPANGATQADMSQPFQWTTVANVQAYYLYVGTTVGAKNLIDTGEIQQTSYLALNLPGGQTVYARLWTKLGGVWRYTDSTFSAGAGISAGSLTATMTYPANGAANADMSQPFQWTSVANVQAYYLYVGTTLGAKNLINTGEIQQTSYIARNLPGGQAVYARLWTKVGNVWRYSDSTLTAGWSAAKFLYPLDGATGVDATQPFRWTTAIAAQGYKLYVGTSLGASDILDSGELAGTSYLASGLPSAGILYARVWTKVNGAWTRYTDIAFQCDTAGQPSNILMPVDGTTQFDTAQPFQWSAVAIARGYRLTVGTALGASDLHDSGEIHVTQRFVPNLPVGIPLFGRLRTRIGGDWLVSDFTFRVVRNTVSGPAAIKAALWATNFVRNMASDDDRPFEWTELMQRVGCRYSALDIDYVSTLLDVLAEVNLGTPARRLDVAFNATPPDAHTLVEVLQPGSLRWMVLDPMFDLTARTSDGAWATADDMAQATLASNWSAISYVFLAPAGDAYVRRFYIDYPLLYLNVYHQGQQFVTGQGNSPLAYLQPASLPTTGTRAAYAVRCTSTAAAVDVVIDGTSSHLPCDGIDRLSAVFNASTVAAPSGADPAFQLYRVPRFVF